MSKVICEICQKLFTKSGFRSHQNRKNPCKPKEKEEEKEKEKEKEKEEEEKEEKEKEEEKEFREISLRYNRGHSKEERQDNGIFFSPRKVRHYLWNKVGTLHPKRILEPSFGSGEFLLDILERYPDSELVGIEKNKELFDSVNCPNATLFCADFMDWKDDKKYDLIVGNPPYFILNKEKISKKCMEKYMDCMTGRPNIYIMFLYKCITEHLEKDGIIAFIIPISIYNCSYYQPMRNYIQKHMTILYVETLDKPGFYETSQNTTLLILQHHKKNDNYIFQRNNIYISPYDKELYMLVKDTCTLHDLDLGVKTGSIVWNQVKEQLSDSGTLLIYSSNIKNCKLELDNMKESKKGDKKQYIISQKPTLTGPHILVDRGYGNAVHFNSVLVDLEEFYAENHINVIYPKTEEASIHLKRVILSLQDERTIQFVKWLIGNGSMSSTDLEYIIPIF
jgi:hypothetical protein